MHFKESDLKQLHHDLGLLPQTRIFIPFTLASVHHHHTIANTTLKLPPLSSAVHAMKSNYKN